MSAVDRPSAGVALATYNGARFVGEQLRSILGQTRPLDLVVVSDDASSDATVAVAEDVLATSGVEYILLRNTDRAGALANFERALRACTTDVVFLADQDDVWRPTKVAAMLEAFDPAADAVFSNATVLQDGERRSKTLWDTVSFPPSARRRWAEGDPFGVLLHGNVVVGATLAFRQRVLSDALPLIDPGWHDQWIALLLAATGRGIVALDEPLMDYRIHADNTIGLPTLTPLKAVRSRRAKGDVRSNAAAFFEQAIVRLEGLGVEPAMLEQLRRKAEHLRRRAELRSPIGRVGAVGRELLNGHYFRYGHGLTSAGADLLSGPEATLGPRSVSP